MKKIVFVSLMSFVLLPWDVGAQNVVDDLYFVPSKKENVKEERVFKKDGEQMWICRNCGHVHFGAEAPEVCPVCAHPKAYFELRSENY